MARRTHPGQPDPGADDTVEPQFERLFRDLHAPLCEVAFHYVRSRAVAEEIVQDLFFALWRAGDRHDVRTVRAYLFTAARNGAIGHLRREGVSRRWVERAEQGLAPNAMSQPALPADVAMERAEAGRALQRAIESLPERARLALVLRWEHSMSHGAVADAMGISVKGVEKLIATAMRKLRGQLVDDARDEDAAAAGGTR